MGMTNRILAFLAVAAMMIAATGAPERHLSSGEVLSLRSGPLSVQSHDGEGAVRIVDGDTIRIVVEPGDQFRFDRDRGKANERAELSSKTKIPMGGSATADLAVRYYDMGEFRPGRWVTLLQLHGPNRNTLQDGSRFGPPVLAVQQRGQEIIVLARWGSDRDGELIKQEVARFPADFGVWHDYRYQVGLGEEGFVSIDRDGEPLVRWSGPIGYDAGDRQHYWKMGIYRSGEWESVSQLDMRIGCIGKSTDCEA